jgi:hypothetical protein
MNDAKMPKKKRRTEHAKYKMSDASSERELSG